MSFLAPLYALGALAVALPVIFHLIQRRPRGQIQFGSLMFLSSSPPRLTRRSRLENLPLLLLRAAALILLALAFARPFMRSLAQLDSEPPSRRMLLLVDTSASMQREDLWRQALDRVNQTLDDLRPTDQVALATFDSTVQTLVQFEQSTGVSQSRREALFRAALTDVSPGWAATDLGRALVTAADMLHTSADNVSAEEGAGSLDAGEGAIQMQVMLISDLQSGSKLEQLKGYQWPADIELEIKRVSTRQRTNATVVVLADQDNVEADAAELRVRVFNAADSSQQQFRLGWVDATGKMLEDREYRVQVPPGSSRVIRVDRPAVAINRLMLQGDDHVFDNVVHVAQPKTQEKTLLYLGDEEEDPRSSLLYYLRRVSLDRAWLKVTLEQRSPRELLLAPEPNKVPLIVAGAVVPNDGVKPLRSYLRAGGRLLYVLTGSADTYEPATEFLRQLTAVEDVAIDEAEVRDYAMLSEIDFQHPLFRPLADPRFNDFTKIRFWSHRVIQLKNNTAASEQSDATDTEVWDILARFDDRSPALVERRIGEGYVWVLTAGWQPTESQLALSTKFIPLLAGMFDPARGQLALKRSYAVDERIELPSDTEAKFAFPDGTVQNIEGDVALAGLDTPGVYSLVSNEIETPFAVNIAFSESGTAPLEPDELEQHGVRMSRALTMGELRAQQRQMRDVELESGQKLWRWLIMGVLGILAAETLLGGWLSRRMLATAPVV